MLTTGLCKQKQSTNPAARAVVSGWGIYSSLKPCRSALHNIIRRIKGEIDAAEEACPAWFQTLSIGRSVINPLSQGKLLERVSCLRGWFREREHCQQTALSLVLCLQDGEEEGEKRKARLGRQWKEPRLWRQTDFVQI